MANLQERINSLFNKFNVNLKTEETSDIEVKLEAEAVLENGTVIYTDAAAFEDGADVFILNEEGEKMPLPDGEYTLEDGTALVIADGGKISSAVGGAGDAEGEGEGKSVAAPANAPKGGKKPVAAKPPVKKVRKSKQDKLAEDEEEVEEEIKEEEELEMDEAYIIDLINKVLDERMPKGEVVEEELAAEEAVTQLKAQLEELKSQAAAEGVKRVTPTAKAMPDVDLTSLSTEERIKALFNKYNS
tara:strand:+ start:7511 stop:8242 length:732 start_codon:yes stop_codon:yes gene_type:complete